MSRLARKSPSVCTDSPLSNSEVRLKVHLMSQTLTSCFGPNGRLKQIHNNVGGHVLTTSTSSVILRALTLSDPLLKLITASILNHLSRFSDCGLYTAILCFGLIDQATRSDFRRSVAIKVYRQVLGMCTRYLNEEDCRCKVRIDFSNTESLVTLARGVIVSKPACMLSGVEAGHIARLAVQAFLLTVPCDSPGRVCFGRTEMVPIEGQPPIDSAVYPGLLVDAPDTPPLTDVEKLRPCGLRLVVFNSSLSGDLFELGEGTLEVHRGADPESDTLEQLLSLGEQVVKDEVDLFACQKVIHPILQHYLRRHEVVVIERLGIALVEPILQMTGAQPVATFHAPIPAEAYGRVGGVSIKRFGPKEMLHLLPPGEPSVCTAVLCHRNETVLSEMKVVFQKAEQVLRLSLKEPVALLGGGCTETHLAAYLRHKGGGEAPALARALGISQPEYLLWVDGFCRSLEGMALALEHDGGDRLIDLSHGHHWSVPRDSPPLQGQWAEAPGACGCGLVERRSGLEFTPLNTRYQDFPPAAVSISPASRPRVLDSFTAKVNALQVAVETANLVLDVGYIIQDVN